MVFIGAPFSPHFNSGREEEADPGILKWFINFRRFYVPKQGMSYGIPDAFWPQSQLLKDALMETYCFKKLSESRSFCCALPHFLFHFLVRCAAAASFS